MQARASLPYDANAVDTALAEGVLEGFQSGDIAKVKAGFAENATIIQWLGAKAPRLVGNVYPVMLIDAFIYDLSTFGCYFTGRKLPRTISTYPCRFIPTAFYCVLHWILQGWVYRTHTLKVCTRT